MATEASQSPKEAFLAKYGEAAWKCKPGDEWYYSLKSPDDQMSVFNAVIAEPLLNWTGIRPPPDDPTYGRYTLPFSPREKRVRDDKRYAVWDDRVYLDDAGEATDKKTNSWVFYQVWWNEAAAKEKGVEADVVFCHGINDYGGRLSAHTVRFLDAGYRVILPDLPAHGRSTGLHCFLPSTSVLAGAVHEVLCAVASRDLRDGRIPKDATRGRKTVVSGQSMGGFTAVLYAIVYHGKETHGIKKKAVHLADFVEPNVVGLMALCPMLRISPHSRPSYLVELVARTLAAFAGRFGLAAANKGKNSEDPWIEQEFEADPQTYHGHLRISTGLACLKGIMWVEHHLSSLTLPVRVMHGLADRVTDTEGSKLLLERASSTDKELELYEGYEHVMMREGRDPEDDQKRQRIISDMLTWLEKHV